MSLAGQARELCCAVSQGALVVDMRRCCTSCQGVGVGRRRLLSQGTLQQELWAVRVLCASVC